MEWLGEMWRRLRYGFRRREFDRDLADEVRFHLQMKEEANRNDGLPADEARHSAQRKFGNATLLIEKSREAWGWTAVEALAQDFRYALRLVRRAPGFAAITTLTLALGIGANTAIFSLVDAIMLRPLPYREPDRLISLWEVVPRQPPEDWHTSGSSLGGVRLSSEPHRMTVAPANLADYRAGVHAFSGIAALAPAGRNLTGEGPPERLWGEAVTSDFFAVLGVGPLLGRSFSAEEDRPGRDAVVVLSQELWERRFGYDRNVLGRTLMLDGRKFEIIGVMPRGFRSPGQFGTTESLSFWVPAAYPPELLANHGDHEVNVVARLRPAMTVERAQAELDAVSARLARTYPRSSQGVEARIAHLRDDLIRNVRTSLLILLGAVGLILLIACFNVANLLLVRAVGRRRELTIRVALGASRWRVVRELVAQSLVLAAAGCLAGLVLGYWAKAALVSLAPSGIPLLEDVSLNGRVLAFTSLLAAASGILFGVLPGWHISKARPGDSLKAQGRTSAGASVMRWRATLMAGEVALSMVLLASAGLLLKSFMRLRAVDLGFETERVLAMSINLPETRYGTPERRFAFFDELASRVAGLPGVEALAFANRMPMRGGWGGGIYIEESREVSPVRECDLQAVSPGYFRTLGIPLVRGRLLTPADRAGAEPVAVVNTEFVRTFFGGADGLGRRFRRSPGQPWFRIVGVVGSVHRGGKQAAVSPQAYLAAAQTGLYPVRLSDLAVRASVEPRGLLGAIQHEVWAIDKDQPVTSVKTLDEVLSQSVAQRRFQTLLLLLFAALALGLALVGVYGVASFSVSQRTAEFGVRIALGAGRGDIARLVLLRSMLLVAAGIAAGTAGALALSRYVRSLLFSVRPTDPAVYATLAVLLAAAALGACYLPARRATRIHPVEALRYE